MDKTIALNPNEVVAYLQKKPAEFTRADLIRFITEKGIRMIDFMYPAEDGRVKTLNFTVNSLEYAETVLTECERVDGSSLFPSFIEAARSNGARPLGGLGSLDESPQTKNETRTRDPDGDLRIIREQGRYLFF